ARRRTGKACAADLGEAHRESDRVCRRCSDTIAIVPEPTVAIGQTLAKVPIFSGLTEGELSFLAQRAVSRNYSAGQSVFGEGEPCSSMLSSPAIYAFLRVRPMDVNRYSVLMVRAVRSPNFPSSM